MAGLKLSPIAGTPCMVLLYTVGLTIMQDNRVISLDIGHHDDSQPHSCSKRYSCSSRGTADLSFWQDESADEFAGSVGWRSF